MLGYPNWWASLTASLVHYSGGSSLLALWAVHIALNRCWYVEFFHQKLKEVS